MSTIKRCLGPAIAGAQRPTRPGRWRTGGRARPSLRGGRAAARALSLKRVRTRRPCGSESRGRDPHAADNREDSFQVPGAGLKGLRAR
jgi:hypothetical protein